MRKEISFKLKLFAFYAAILVASISVFTVLTIRISNRVIVGKAAENANQQLALIDRGILDLTQNFEDYVRILANDGAMQEQLERMGSGGVATLDYLGVEQAISKAISNVAQPTTRVAAASVMDAGQAVFDVGYVDNASLSAILGAGTVDRVARNKTPTWLGLFKLKYRYGGEDDVFAIAKAIIGMDTGKRLGTAVLYLKEADVAGIYMGNLKDEDDEFFVIDSRDVIISSRDKGELYKRFDAAKYLGQGDGLAAGLGESLAVGSGEGLAAGQALADGAGAIRVIDGTRALVTVKGIDKLGWRIVSVVPLDEITAENRAITRLIVVLCVACLACAFTASYLLSTTISRPILELVGTMKRVEGGDLDARADVRAKGEIGMLGDGFNGLMGMVNGLLAQVYKDQELKRENEFKLLQSQVKPHFLYNTIETIISFIKLGMKDNAMTTARYLADFYRLSLSKGDDIVTLREEAHIIDSYLSIQRLRYIEYMDYRLSFEEGALCCEVPKLTLQPLVENSIVHGLQQREEGGLLTVRGYREGGDLKIEVTDNGVGMTGDMIRGALHPSPDERRLKDFGIHSVDSRLKLLYGERYGLAIESRVGEYTKVTVALPANER
jgi:two-component system sensor histidine kinase YesM